jgi:hypothetical protein
MRYVQTSLENKNGAGFKVANAEIGKGFIGLLEGILHIMSHDVDLGYLSIHDERESATLHSNETSRLLRPKFRVGDIEMPRVAPVYAITQV